MGAYVLRRILIAIPVLIGITIVAFTALSLAPGDPLMARLDPAILARIQANPTQLAAMRHELGIDQPLPIRYVLWLAGALQGDFGYSISSHRTIVFEVSKRIPPTLALMGSATAIALLAGIPFGVLSALRQYSKADYALTSATMLMASTPTFVLGLAGVYIFAVWLHLVPSSGIQTLGKPANIPDFVWHLALPAMVLGRAQAHAFLEAQGVRALLVAPDGAVTTVNL